MSQILTNFFTKKISSWNSWNARKYLDTFYSIPMGDTFATLDFINDELDKYKTNPFDTALEFGSGPTLLGALAISPFVKSLHLADYLPENLEEINRWLLMKKDAFNWDKCTSYLLNKDGIETTPYNIALRSNDLRNKINKLFLGDITKDWPLLNYTEKYDLLVSLFCADSITNSKIAWNQNMKNLFQLAKPKGTIIIGALRNCTYYRVGKHYFPCANINENDFEQFFFNFQDIIDNYTIRVNEVKDCSDEGFTSVVFARITLK